jgi:hypothetical protein
MKKGGRRNEEIYTGADCSRFQERRQSLSWHAPTGKAARNAPGSYPQYRRKYTGQNRFTDNPDAERPSRWRSANWLTGSQRGRQCRHLPARPVDITATRAGYTALLRVCDVHNVPLATNLASAEGILNLIIKYPDVLEKTL